MPKLFDRVKVNIATTGTGDVTFGSASSTAFLTPTESGCIDGDTVRYVIVDGTDYEEGIGTIASSVATMARTTVTKSKIGGTAGTTKLNLSGTAVLALIASAADVLNPVNNLSDLKNAAEAITNLGAVQAAASSTDNALARFDAATGAVIKNSDITLGDNDGKLTRSAGISISGTNTDDDAAAGYAGELLENAVASGSSVSITSGLSKSVVSLTLGPGDYDVVAMLNLRGDTATQLRYVLAETMTTTDATPDTVSTLGIIQTVYPSGFTPFVIAHMFYSTARRRFSLAATTTLYLNTYTNHTAGNVLAYGRIVARRVR